MAKAIDVDRRLRRLTSNNEQSNEFLRIASHPSFVHPNPTFVHPIHRVAGAPVGWGSWNVSWRDNIIFWNVKYVPPPSSNGAVVIQYTFGTPYCEWRKNRTFANWNLRLRLLRKSYPLICPPPTESNATLCMRIIGLLNIGIANYAEDIMHLSNSF